MIYSLYQYSLCASLTLMLFFGVYFILGKVPPKPIFNNYRRSRTIMGGAMLLLAANYVVHMFVHLRFSIPEAAIFMNLSTYFLAAWLFSSALTSLLEKHYLNRRLFVTHLILWGLYTALGSVIFLLPGGTPRVIGLLAMAGLFVIYAFRLARLLFRSYKRAVQTVDDFHSDDIAAYIRWVSIFTYWAIVFGVLVGVLTFLPDEYIFLWIISAIPFYIYLFCSYMNYLLFYEQVETILENEIKSSTQDEQVQEEVIDELLPEKIINENVLFLKQGVVLADYAKALNISERKLSEYINSTYGMNFKRWVNRKRVEYAQELAVKNPEMTIDKIAEQSGFTDRSHLSRVFKEITQKSLTQLRNL